MGNPADTEQIAILATQYGYIKEELAGVKSGLLRVVSAMDKLVLLEERQVVYAADQKEQARKIDNHEDRLRVLEAAAPGLSEMRKLMLNGLRLFLAAVIGAAMTIGGAMLTGKIHYDDGEIKVPRELVR